MKPTLRALLAGIVDYAGMFPPARLPLHTAIADYARYRAGGDAWMLGRFICPAAKLGELEEHRRRLFAEGEPLRVSALGRGGATSEEFLAHTYADAQAIRAYLELAGQRSRVDVFEVRLPADAVVAGRPQAVGHLLRQTRDLLQQNLPQPPKLFVEITPGSQWREQVSTTLTALQETNRYDAAAPPAGFKLRCGGLEAAAFPSPEQVAFCLRRCLDRKLAFKATAGLHHPLPRRDEAIGVTMHGFVNVFGGGVLAHVHGLDERQIAEILTDEDPAHFDFREERFSWKSFSASVTEIADVRHQLLLSFGSCSFDEPRDDLRALGWL